MKITGKLLKEKREKKGISIGEVALATKINNRTIVALEEGDLDNLPPKTFLRGFVRSYASFLELDVEQILTTFYDEMGTTKPKSSAPDGSPGPAGTSPSVAAPQKNRGSTPGADEAINPTTSLTVKIGAVVGILLLVVLIVFFKNKMESYEKESQHGDVPANLEALTSSPTPTVTASPDPNASPSASASPGALSGTPATTTTETLAGTSTTAAALTSPSPSKSASVEAAAKTAASSPDPKSAAHAEIAPNSATPSAPNTANKPNATPSPPPVLKPVPHADIAPAPKPTVTPPPPTPSPASSGTADAAAASAEAIVKPSPSPTPKPARPQEVIVEALDSVDVDLQVDGEPSKKIHLKSDQVQSIKAKRKVVMKLSDGGAVNVIVNGNDRGVPGDLGKPLRLEIP